MTARKKIGWLTSAMLGLLISSTVALGDEPTLAKLGFGGLKSVSVEKARTIRGKGGITISPITISRSINLAGTIGATQGVGIDFAAIHGVSIERTVGIGYSQSFLADVQQSYGVGRTVSFTYPGFTFGK